MGCLYTLQIKASAWGPHRINFRWRTSLFRVSIYKAKWWRCAVVFTTVRNYAAVDIRMRINCQSNEYPLNCPAELLADLRHFKLPIVHNVNSLIGSWNTATFISDLLVNVMGCYHQGPTQLAVSFANPKHKWNLMSDEKSYFCVIYGVFMMIAMLVWIKRSLRSGLMKRTQMCARRLHLSLRFHTCARTHSHISRGHPNFLGGAEGGLCEGKIFAAALTHVKTHPSFFGFFWGGGGGGIVWR